MPTPEKKIAVTVAVPNMMWIHVALLPRLLEISNDYRYDLRYDFDFKQPIENNRNHMVKRFLENGDDYLLMMDSDNPPTKNPLDLVEEDKDIMVLPTPMWPGNKAQMQQIPIVWNAMKETQTGEDAYEWCEVDDWESMIECDAGGTGCILIARRVLEAIRAPFLRIFDDDGCVKRGSDLYFCQRAKAAGFEIWAHYGYWCQHYKTIDLAQVFLRMMHLMHPDLKEDS